MTLDQKIADLHTAIHRVETQQARILMMFSLHGFDESVIKESTDRLETRLGELEGNNRNLNCAIDVLQARIFALQADA